VSEQQPPARPAVAEPAPEPVPEPGTELGTEPGTEPGSSVASTPPARGRGKQTAGDMVRSLLVVLALVFVVVALNMQDDNSGEAVRPLDYSGALAQARDTAPYDVLSPTGLPNSWVPTSARTGRDGDAVTWHLGFVTPAGDYGGVEQSDGDPEALVADVAGGGDDTGTVTINGLRWRKVDGGRPEKHALVLEGDAATTVVAGGASWAELRTLARALQAAGS
jgi:hypothetical protein